MPYFGLLHPYQILIRSKELLNGNVSNSFAKRRLGFCFDTFALCCHKKGTFYKLAIYCKVNPNMNANQVFQFRCFYGIRNSNIAQFAFARGIVIAKLKRYVTYRLF